MKKLLLVLLAVLLCASVADAYVIRTIGSGWKSKFTGAAFIKLAEEEDKGLGSVKFSLHPYTINTPEAGSVKPGNPLVAKIEIKKAAGRSPPITVEETSSGDGVTILVTEIGPEGDIQMYATSNVKGNILPSNIIRYDASPDVQAWTNDKFVANSNVNTRIQYVILVKYKNDAKVLTHTLNVR